MAFSVASRHPPKVSIDWLSGGVPLRTFGQSQIFD